MAEVKKKTDAWEMHKILSEFDPDKFNNSIISESTNGRTTDKSSSIMGNGFQTALTLSKNNESAKSTKGKCFVM